VVENHHCGALEPEAGLTSLTLTLEEHETTR
jgi:hypothetical protein